MKKTKEQLELLVVLQKHKIEELREIYVEIMMSSPLLVNRRQLYLRIAKAKMKLNHYKQLLGNATSVVLLPIEQPPVRLQFGDRVRIKDGWQNSELYVLYLAKFIGLEGIVRIASGDSNYRVRTSLDEDVPDNILFNFPPEALELVTKSRRRSMFNVGDKVRVVRKVGVEFWNSGMDDFVNDGRSYIVTKQIFDKPPDNPPDYKLENGYWFPEEALELTQ